MVVFPVDTARFDPLGRAPTYFANMVLALPQELAVRLKDARFGVLNQGDDAPEESDEDKVRAELERRVLTGEIIVLDKESGQRLAPAGIPEITVANQGSLYGVLLEFGGYQSCFVGAPECKSFDALANWLPTKADIAAVCLVVK